MNRSNALQWHTYRGEPTTVHNVTISPEIQILRVRFPFGGLTWSWPRAVIIATDEGTKRLPIQDVTRRIVWSAALLCLLLGLVARE